MDHDEIVRLYGAWRHRTPEDVVELMRDYPGEWWIAGGWAIEAFTNCAREHGDVDPSIPRSDVPLLRDHLRGRLDIWAADRGTLHPVTDDATIVPVTCSNLWLRKSGCDPWEYNFLLTDVSSGRWTYKRDERVSLPAEEILWSRNGISFLKPEVQLLYKAPGFRLRDQHDFGACLPLLTRAGAIWLRTALETAHPGHPWIDALVV